jgi:hypothetical protein
MKFNLLFLLLLAACSFAQTTAEGALVVGGCTLTPTQDGKITVDCPKPTDTGIDPRKWYSVCTTRLVGVPTQIAIDPTSAELIMLDLDKLVAAMTPPPSTQVPNPTPGNPWDAAGLPWQTLVKAVTTRAEWEALPVSKRWGLVKQQPPTQYSRIAISGACLTDLFKILNLKAEEPL